MPRTPTVPANGATIRALRVKDGYSIAGLARAAGIAHSHLIYIEREEKVPSERTLNKIARALAVPTAALMRNTAPDDHSPAARRSEGVLHERHG